MTELVLRASCALGVPECLDTSQAGGIAEIFTVLAVVVVVAMVIVFSMKNRKQ